MNQIITKPCYTDLDLYVQAESLGTKLFTITLIQDGIIPSTPAKVLVNGMLFEIEERPDSPDTGNSVRATYWSHHEYRHD